MDNMILHPGDIGIDYSWARPDVAAIVAAGVRVVARYISPVRSNGKNLTATERDGLLGAGLGLICHWEASATDPLGGAPKGSQHGGQADSFAHDLGYPAHVPIVVAVDFDVQPSQMPTVLAYLRAFGESCSYPIGVYGGIAAVTAAYGAGLVSLVWQTRAWSHGRLSPHADARQEIGYVHPGIEALGAVDDNTVLRAFTVWSTVADPTPVPTPIGNEDDMRFVRDAGTGQFWEWGTGWLPLPDGSMEYAPWAAPISELGLRWEEIGPLIDALGGLKDVPHETLQAIYGRHGRPPAAATAGTPGPSGMVAAHSHTVSGPVQ